MTGDNRRTAAMSAREIADITFGADDLFELVLLKMIASCLSARIGSNYRLIIGFTSALIALGVAGILPRPPPRCCTICPLWASACAAWPICRNNRRMTKEQPASICDSLPPYRLYSATAAACVRRQMAFSHAFSKPGA